MPGKSDKLKPLCWVSPLPNMTYLPFRNFGLFRGPVSPLSEYIGQSINPISLNLPKLRLISDSNLKDHLLLERLLTVFFFV